MTSPLDQVLSMLGPETVARMGNQIGASPSQAHQAISAALPLLMGAMARNVQTPDGAQALHAAAVRDHAGNDLMALLGGLLGGGRNNGAGGGALGAVLGALGGMGGGGGAAGAGSPLSAGMGILGHVLGGAQNRAAGGVASAGGMSSSSAIQLMAMLAPLVMTALGRQAQQQQLGPDGLAGLLGQEMGRFGLGGGAQQTSVPAASSRPPLGPIDRLLDADGDGVVDAHDLMARGSSLLGAFMRR